jgi:hypothetical protein
MDIPLTLPWFQVQMQIEELNGITEGLAQEIGVQKNGTSLNRDSERIPRRLSKRSKDPAYRGGGEGSN